ncbi:calcium-binding protein, partial [Microvirga sp. BT689]|nr:calcium-binding protein [Microvirga arvi]
DQIFGGADDDNLNGDNGNDRLFGEAGFDILKGGAGDDIVSGGRGNDNLRGGVGRDAFRFDAAPNAVSNKDLVVDFRSADDVFHIDNAVFRKVGANGRLKADAFHLGARAEDAEDRIIYHKATGTLFYDPDGTGHAAQIEFAQLANRAAVKLNDFLIV